MDVKLPLDFILNVVLFDTPFGSEDDIREVILCLWNKDAGKKVKKQDLFSSPGLE